MQERGDVVQGGDSKENAHLLKVAKEAQLKESAKRENAINKSCYMSI